MIEKLTERLMAWCERKGRVLKITGTGADTDTYLIRYYVIQSRWFNFFIHQFLRSDRDDMHDHPWDFVTYLVRGGYREQRWQDGLVTETRRSNYPLTEFAGMSGEMERHLKRRNRFVFRKATDQHKVLVYQTLTEAQKADAALTICITGPTRRVWGFWKTEKVTVPCPDKRNACAVAHFIKMRVWVDWRDYLGLPRDAKSRG